MSTATAEGPLPALKSLRAKGWIATLALLAYLLASAVYIAGERSQVFESVQQLEALASHEKALAVAEAAVNGALVDVSEAGSAGHEPPAQPQDLRLYMENCTRLFQALEAFDPGYALIQRAIARSYAQLSDAPLRVHWIELREALSRAVAELEIRHRRLADQRDALNAGYQRQYDAVTVESLLLAMLGIVVFGSLAAWFFARLAGDVRRLEAHARQIVRGARGVSLQVRRDDELGRLMQAVDRMAADLDEREKQIELDGQRRSHQDKMLALGALAAGVAHEVNNPLAVIAGVAQQLQPGDGPPPTPEQLATSARTILAHTQRAAQVARHLADAAAPQTAELDWLDVNALVRHVVQLMGYDRRYRGFGFELQADAALPAVRSSAAAVQQVLMQLLSLACDAMVAGGEKASWLGIRCEPAGGAGGACISLCLPPVLDFSRPEVQRSLLLCRAIVEPLGGRLAFGQAEGGRVRMTLSLPIDHHLDRCPGAP